MDETTRSRLAFLVAVLSFLIAALIVVGSFLALLLQRCTWDQALTGVLVALTAVGLYHAPAPGQSVLINTPKEDRQ